MATPLWLPQNVSLIRTSKF